MINPLLRSLIIGIIISFIITLSYLVFKKKIRERDSFVWYLLLFILLFFSIFYKFTDYIAEIFDVAYPLSLLFLLGIFTLFVINFYHAYKISELTDQVNELAQRLALRTDINKEDNNVNQDKS